MEENRSKELAKTYDPKGLEDRLYKKWLDKNISTQKWITTENPLPS